MSARRQIITVLSKARPGGVATLADVAHAEQLVDAYRAEVLAEVMAAVCAVCGRPIVRFACDLTGGAWMHARGNTDADDDLRTDAGHQAVPAEKATPAGATATPGLTERQAWLLARITTEGGRWKTGRARTAYSQGPYGSVGVDRVRRDLQIIHRHGYLHEHDESGVRFYTLNSRKDGRS